MIASLRALVRLVCALSLVAVCFRFFVDDDRRFLGLLLLLLLREAAPNVAICLRFVGRGRFVCFFLVGCGGGGGGGGDGSVFGLAWDGGGGWSGSGGISAPSIVSLMTASWVDWTGDGGGE